MLRKDIPIYANGREQMVYVYGDTREDVDARAQVVTIDLQRQGYQVLTPELCKGAV